MSTFRLCSRDDAAAVYFHHYDCERPAQSNTQWLSFRFVSNGLFTHSPFSHLAVVLRARLGLDQAGRPCSISGRGMTLGDTSSAVTPETISGDQRKAFGGARGMQIESFWPGGNFLWRSTGRFPDGLCDGIQYRVQLHANDQRWIAYAVETIRDGRVIELGRAEVQDSAVHPVVPEATGLLIALGRDLRETGPWQVEFEDIAWGWF